MVGIPDVATIVQALAVITACWAIVSGIGAWKREFLGKRQIELAEETLAKFFEIRDAITFIRNPIARMDEGKTRQHGQHESEEESALLDRGYIVIERYNQRETAFADFNVLKHRFMASFGVETEPIFTRTYKVVNSVFSAARTLALHYWPQWQFPMHDPEKYKIHLGEKEKLKESFGTSGPKTIRSKSK